MDPYTLAYMILSKRYKRILAVMKRNDERLKFGLNYF